MCWQLEKADIIFKVSLLSVVQGLYQEPWWWSLLSCSLFSSFFGRFAPSTECPCLVQSPGFKITYFFLFKPEDISLSQTTYTEPNSHSLQKVVQHAKNLPIQEGSPDQWRGRVNQRRDSISGQTLPCAFP